MSWLKTLSQATIIHLQNIREADFFIPHKGTYYWKPRHREKRGSTLELSWNVSITQNMKGETFWIHVYLLLNSIKSYQFTILYQISGKKENIIELKCPVYHLWDPPTFRLLPEETMITNLVVIIATTYICICKLHIALFSLFQIL